MARELATLCQVVVFYLFYSTYSTLHLATSKATQNLTFVNSYVCPKHVFASVRIVQK